MIEVKYDFLKHIFETIFEGFITIFKTFIKFQQFFLNWTFHFWVEFYQILKIWFTTFDLKDDVSEEP